MTYPVNFSEVRVIVDIWGLLKTCKHGSSFGGRQSIDSICRVVSSIINCQWRYDVQSILPVWRDTTSPRLHTYERHGSCSSIVNSAHPLDKPSGGGTMGGREFLTWAIQPSHSKPATSFSQPRIWKRLLMSGGEYL
jgi:hypothetical protein